MSSTKKHDESLIGKVVLGRYRILSHLADGGMGSIYLARSEGTGGFMRAVVVKAVLPGLVGDGQMIELFRREARIMSNLRHPGIVSVIDFAEERDMLFMVLEYVHGFNLGRWHHFMRKTDRQFPLPLACYIVQHVLRALQCVHTLKDSDGQPLGIVHRDVTASNVLIDVDGHVKLADFGIARAASDHTTSASKTVKGKFPYLAPELYDSAEPSAASDVYSAGVTLHELLVGKNEFFAADAKAVVARVLHHVPTRIDEVRSDAPPGLAAVVAKALAKDPTDRFATAAEFAEALSRVRTMPEEELAVQLAENAARDFLDPRMAELLHLPQLNTLEAAWRTPVSERLVLSSLAHEIAAEPARGVSEAPEAADGHTADTKIIAPASLGPPSLTPAPFATGAGAVGAAGAAATVVQSAAPRARGRGWLVVGGVIGVAAIAAGTAMLVSNRASPPPPQDPAYVVVQDDGKDEPPPPPPTTPAQAADDAAVPGVVAPAPPDPKPEPAVKREPKPREPESVAARLTRTFGRQKARITACFQQHAVGVTGAPELSVRIEVGADGTVTAAQLSPDSIAGTDLGQCLLAVARATRFDPQPEPVAFRVPIKAKIKE